MFSPTPSWYALYVRSHQEDKLKARLEKELGDQFQFMVPKRRLRERKAGVWHYVERKLLPGYILVKGTLSFASYYKTKATPDVFKWLKTESEILRIEENELKVLNILISKDETIGISKLYKEKDHIRVIQGPLTGLEGQIVSINARKGRAKVRLSLANDEKIVELGIEVVDKL